MEKWIIRLNTLGLNKTYRVETEHGKIIATGIRDHGIAVLISQLPELNQLRYDWSSIINSLAHYTLNGADSNARDYAEDMIVMVRPHLESFSLLDDS